ncbi:MAG: hypothetical protein C9356_12940 [Oleiphilus sp.]|nr:MAG: hypothetical protein C9356_12940 [Oleiphilus sp.]
MRKLLLSINRAVPAILFILLFAGFSGYTFIRYQNVQSEVLDSAKQQLLSSGNLLSASIESAIRYNTKGIVRSAIEQSQTVELISLALLLDQENRVFSATLRSYEGKQLKEIDDPNLVRHLADTPNALSLAQLKGHPPRIIYQASLSRQSQEHGASQLVDRLVLVADLSEAVALAGQRVLIDASIWFGLSLTTTLLIWWLLRYLVINPSQRLVSLANDLANPDKPMPAPQDFRSREFKDMELALRSMAHQLTQWQDSYRTLYENNPATFLTVNRDGILININRYGLEVTGKQAEQLIGQPASILYCEEDQASFEQHLRRSFYKPYEQHHWQLRYQQRDGLYPWVRDVARCIEIEDEFVVLIVSQDVSDLYKLSNRLSYQASHDALTGLINRNEFNTLLEAAIEKTGGSDGQHCLCFLDLDQFKIVNDTCGHVAGDELLKQVADLIQHAIRKDDIVARFGGDEFALLLENCLPEKANEVVANVREAIIDNRFSWEDKFFDIGISAGITVIDSSNQTSQQLLSEADSACYTAKNLGRNRTVIFDDENTAAKDTLEEMNWFNEINKALESTDRFVLFLQRIHTLNPNDKEVYKGEILIRMRDNEGNIIPPGAFLPAAERYHLAHKIDLWVVTESLKTLDEYRSYLPQEWVISINLSAQTVSNSVSANAIFEQLGLYPQFKQHLCFEVTETVAMANYASATQFMRKLQSEGYTLSLDDFGSGFSSFGHLKNMPVDYVKIDGMFIRQLANDKIDQALVSSMNSIAHATGKATIAEFVEDQRSVEILKSLDVDYAQGYHFHKPEPLTNILADLKASEGNQSLKA